MTEITKSDEVVALWNQGMTGSQIAKIVNMTVGKVSGLIHRARHRGEKVRGQILQTEIKRPVVVEAPPVAIEEPEIVDGEEIVNLKSIPFIDRQPAQRARGQLDIPFDGTSRDRCQWPSWSISKKTGTVCGLPIEQRSGIGYTIPYCNHHYKCAYNPPDRRKR